MRFALTTTLLIASCATLNAQTIGSTATSGSGCVSASDVIYELFPAGSIDLDGNSVSFVPNANGSYDTIPMSGVAALPFGGTNTGSGDDTVVGPFAYGFDYPLVTGGTSSGCDIGSNGHVLLTSGTGGASRCCSGAAAISGFLGEGPSFGVFSIDMNVNANGTIWWDTATDVAYATWDMVAEFGTSNFQSCQAQFHSNGRVDLVYFGVGTTGDTVLIGYSPGGGANDPGSSDLSAGPLSGQTPIFPLALNSGDTPTVGETFNFDISNVPASSTFGGILLGTGSQAAPIDLSVIGMEGDCFLTTLADIPIALPATLTSPTGSASLAIGPDPGQAGLTITSQAVVNSPGANTLGAVISNQLDLNIGDFSFCPPGISVTLNGTNTFNSNTAFGYFSIKHNSSTAADIASVVLDFTPSATTFEFDTDQTGMADRFDGGGVATAASCNNTYRNGSDAATGLVFAGTQSSACTQETGFNGSNQVGTTPDFQTLQFDFTSFANGDTFEFDCDTDGGLGISGGSVGPSLTVTITLTDSTVLTGVPMMVNSTVSQLVFP